MYECSWNVYVAVLVESDGEEYVGSQEYFEDQQD
jgi:hypothetical protein